MRLRTVNARMAAPKSIAVAIEMCGLREPDSGDDSSVSMDRPPIGHPGTPMMGWSKRPDKSVCALFTYAVVQRH
jgi:hypothetical protein